jgi:hypothetical protein
LSELPIPKLIRNPCPSPISKSSILNSGGRSNTAFGKVPARRARLFLSLPARGRARPTRSPIALPISASTKFLCSRRWETKDCRSVERYPTYSNATGSDQRRRLTDVYLGADFGAASVAAKSGAPSRRFRRHLRQRASQSRADRTALQAALPDGARVGSVDKFQGQEAPVCILSLCSRCGEYGSRGLAFILDRNRINVAISRAQCLAVVVADPRIASTAASSIDEMMLLNVFCKLANS